MVKEEKQEERVERKERFELVKVPIQSDVYVQDTKTEELLDQMAILLKILNKLEKIERTVA